MLSDEGLRNGEGLIGEEGISVGDLLIVEFDKDTNSPVVGTHENLLSLFSLDKISNKNASKFAQSSQFILGKVHITISIFFLKSHVNILSIMNVYV